VCVVSVTSATATSVTYHAIVGTKDGTTTVAAFSSPDVAVTWTPVG
jgi:hypothetical protein